MIRKLYVWEAPVRLSHWLNILTIISLSVTGYYISNPFLYAISENQSIMSQMRFIHFLSAYALIASLLIRTYWLFAGNRFARLKEFFPYTPKQLKEILYYIQFYLFLRKDMPHPIGHNSLAAIAYTFVYAALFIAALTGLALYSETHTGSFWYLSGGWILGLLSAGSIRLIHHSTMWLLFVFAVVHIYTIWLNDNIEGNGLISSIFTGCKIIGRD